MDDVVCAARRRNILGEGPCWDGRAGRLYWLDIKGRRLEWLSPATGAASGWDLDRQVSALAMRAPGGLVVATEDGFATFDPDTGVLELRCPIEPERIGNRTNDGGLDRQGRWWVGTMDDAVQRRTGAVYRLDPDWTCRRMLDGYGIPNTFACTEDGRSLLIADSMDQLLRRYPLDVATGALGEPAPFAHTQGQDATPDGGAMDAEGFLWNAQWGGWRLVRYAPDGSVDRVVEMPVEQPSSCAFGGEGLRTLFVTSAREGLSEADLEDQPLAGSLFAVDVGVAGLDHGVFPG